MEIFERKSENFQKNILNCVFYLSGNLLVYTSIYNSVYNYYYTPALIIFEVAMVVSSNFIHARICMRRLYDVQIKFNVTYATPHMGGV